MYTRRVTKKIFVGSVPVGGDSSISVQTMTNTNTEDVLSTLAQIEEAKSAGADIIRVSCPTKESTIAIREIVNNSPIPIIADIHFDYRRAIEAIDNGVQCVRINPGNLSDIGIKEIVKKAKANGVSIRLGINSGSIMREILEKHGGEPTVGAIVESAILYVKKLEDLDFVDFKISVKSSDVMKSIEAYRKLSEAVTYPLHLGITEAGPLFSGVVKSSIGIGSLLADGIGDTLRVSLSVKDIKEEVKVGKQILKSLGLLDNSVNIVACPTCARTLIDVAGIASKLEKLTENLQKKMKISILGCVVNGLGEAHDSDIGIFGFQKGIAKVYKNKKFLKTCSENELVEFITKVI